MIRETYKGRKLKATKGNTYGKSRISVNGTECGQWFGTQEDVINWAKSTIDDVDSRPFEGRWAECWYEPGTYELNEHGHIVAPGGICSCDYCEKRRIQPCANITAGGICVCTHCQKPAAERAEAEQRAAEYRVKKSEEQTPATDIPNESTPATRRAIRRTRNAVLRDRARAHRDAKRPHTLTSHALRAGIPHTVATGVAGALRGKVEGIKARLFRRTQDGHKVWRKPVRNGRRYTLTQLLTALTQYKPRAAKYAAAKTSLTTYATT